MKQILQHLENGRTELAEVPCPGPAPGSLLIRTSRSLVSSGTERMLVDFGRANLVDKARQQPDKVRMVLDKVKTDGFGPTLAAVRSKLDRPLPMGYCNVGVIAELGAGVKGFRVGERVASNGAHAQVVNVPVNLCARVPEAVSDDEAAFTVIGAIALQGIRLLRPTLGESVVVFGLGLVGQVAIQLLGAHGCRVLGIDPDPQRRELARGFGIPVVDLSVGEDPVAVVARFSRDRGADAVLIAAATDSNEPIREAAALCRKRGRIVLVGTTGLALSRADFYEKELTFQVSCSYGPGRYDPDYEEKGHDYPVGFVRWTEQRNFEAVLDMMADGRLDVKPLISHRFPMDQAQRAYEVLSAPGPSLGILLEYPATEIDHLPRTIALEPQATNTPSRRTAQSVSASFIGAGNYATAVLIPAFRDAGAHLRAVASRTGVSALHAGRKFGFQETATDLERIFEDAGNDAVVITTRHDSHAGFVSRALAAGRHVFVEKPLCLTLAELAKIETEIEAEIETESAARPGDRLLMVGFNRRFAPQVVKIKQLLTGITGPKSFIMTINAGHIPADHWTQDPAVGGGRIVGEACHFIDLARFLAGASLTGWRGLAMESATGDTVCLQLAFADGSIGAIQYFANGSRSFPKERLEVFAAGRVLRLDNFRRLTGYGWPGFRRMNLLRQDKGQRACAAAFVRALRDGGPAPIPLGEILEVSRVSIALQGSVTGTTKDTIHEEHEGTRRRY
uniref:Predicted dehydrogenase n=1 Tax=Candidatus Kentrum sp. FM TaxID=2126340 RepID=A0A450RZV2_9GAMM|nr:MAG: Predicted dehydrogenase [Candidatus Kentron sp. FM]VFJ52149.1 MAG: Predicted dehydrogenase [Candidatus Kentron sp. FM]VFK07630.1 MAG: Predicted dehydrogenase [Candidatus Kentron sp. FM]